MAEKLCQKLGGGVPVKKLINDVIHQSTITGSSYPSVTISEDGVYLVQGIALRMMYNTPAYAYFDVQVNGTNVTCFDGGIAYDNAGSALGGTQMYGAVLKLKKNDIVSFSPVDVGGGKKSFLVMRII